MSASIIHQHLPLLEDYGVISQNDDTITYEGEDVIEEIMETLEDLE